MRMRWLVTICVVVLLIGISSCIFRVKILTCLADFLIVNSELQRSDIIFLLNGGNDTRPFRAYELFKYDFAPKIVIAKAEDTSIVKMGVESGETDVAVKVMSALGVPSEKIVVVSYGKDVTSTRDEADVLRRYVKENAVKRVILVTSALHTRRAKWICEKQLSGLPVILEIATAPHCGFDETNWWKKEKGLTTLVNEYLKLFYYWVKY